MVVVVAADAAGVVDVAFGVLRQEVLSLQGCGIQESATLVKKHEREVSVLTVATE